MKYFFLFITLITLGACSTSEESKILPEEPKTTLVAPTERGLTPYYFTGTTFQEEEFFMTGAVKVEILMKRDCIVEEKEFFDPQSMDVVTDIVSHDCLAQKYERYPSERYRITFDSGKIGYFYKQVYRGDLPEVLPDEDVILPQM